jgi:transcriptional regulator with XRE-family HTH domain
MQKTIHSRHSVLIRDALKKIREEAGFTQRELCRELGKEHTFISKCELGERRIDIAEFYWICKACGASPKKETDKLVKAFDKLNP